MKMPLKILSARVISASGIPILTIVMTSFYDIRISSEFFLGITTLYLLSIITKLGLEVVVLKETSKVKTFPRAVSYEFIISVVKVTLASTILSLLFYFTSTFFDQLRGIVWIAFVLPAFSILGIISFFFRGTENEFFGCLLEPGIISVLTVTLTALAYIFLQPVSIKYIFILSGWLLLLISFVYIFFEYNLKPSKKKSKKNSYIDLSMHSLITQTFNYLLVWYPIYILNLVSPNLVVYYTLANRLAAIIAFIAATIDAYAYPRFSKTWENMKYIEIMAIKKQLDQISIRFSLTSFIILLSVSILYGIIQNYEITYYCYSFILLTSSALALSMGPNGVFLMMTNNSKINAQVAIAASIIVITLTTTFYILNISSSIIILVGSVLIIKSIYFKKTTTDIIFNLKLKHDSKEKV